MSASGQAGVALHTENVLTSVDVLGGDQVEGKNVMNRSQLLGQMPGIQLAETGQGAESGTSKPASNALLSSATKQGLPKILYGHTVNTHGVGDPREGPAAHFRKPGGKRKTAGWHFDSIRGAV